MTSQKVERKKQRDSCVVTTSWEYAEATPAFVKLMALLLRPAGDGYGKQEDEQHR